MKKLALALAVFALVAPAQAGAARFAVGLEPGASPAQVTRDLRAASGGSVSTLTPFALVLRAPSAAGAVSVPGVEFVERLDHRRRVAFVPTDPFAARQWYLPQIRAFDYWAVPPVFQRRVRVAVLDSGIDATHPDLAGKIEAGKSFVEGPWRKDPQGHGTFVAGIIAAEAGNGEGIAGIGLGADLLIAKVVRGDGSISLDAEAKAIHWAVRQGARVINLSFGGVRDPYHPKRDTYSRLEARAIEYAVRRGALVVAAVGNGDQAPSMPWSFAGYPAALPHVVGVSALAREGTVPAFSNRDAIHNDIAAPGTEIFSTLPKMLTSQRSNCPFQGYSECGPFEFRKAEGTSFAAPQVSGAAALLLAVKPELKPDQIASILTRSALDVTPPTGCKRCLYGRDQLSGWGRLDVTAAIDRALREEAPVEDTWEPNDDGGGRSQLLGRQRTRINATVDFWDDPVDVYRVRLRRGERLRLSVRGPEGSNTNLVLWKPGARRLGSFDAQRLRAAQSVGPDAVERVSYRAPKAGSYYVQVKLASAGSGAYVLRIDRARARAT